MRIGGDSITSEFGGAAKVNYLLRTELQPCKDPELECRRAVETLSKSSSKWSSKFDAIDVRSSARVISVGAKGHECCSEAG